MKSDDTELLAKPIAEAIGLDPDSVGRAIKNDEILGAEHTIQLCFAAHRVYPGLTFLALILKV